MHLLVINSGSSSIKFSLFETGEGEPRSVAEGEITGVGSGAARFKFQDAAGKSLGGVSTVKAESPEEAIGLVVEAISGHGMPAVGAVGYRVVHPGPKLDRHQRITDEVIRDLEEAVTFAPLHDPAVIAVIRDTMAKFPDVPHYVCFDTVFHQTMPEAATTYAIPERFQKQGVRRYGFHGLSCESIVRQLEKREGGVPQRMVIAHLGSGCSVTALVDGRSVDTTMGLTPTGGIVMGTRPGDLDPGLVLYLLRQMQGSDKVAELETMLNHDAGMVALSGLPNDMKMVREAAANGDAKAKLAIEIFTRSVKKAIGGFAALMGGMDTLVFAGGIGEHDALSREEIMCGLENPGILVNSEANKAKGEVMRRLDASDRAAAVLVVPAKEDWMIALHMEQMLQAGN